MATSGITRIRLNRRGVGQLLKSPEVAADLGARGQRIAEAAGGGDDYEVESTIGRTRARTTVRTATPAAMVREGRDHRLARALDAGR